MIIKKHIALLLLLFPLISMSQKRVSLLPMADVVFHEKSIIYLIHPDENIRVEPLSFPQKYQTEYLHTKPQKVQFENMQTMLGYLLTTKTEQLDNDDAMLFLRALTLYKIINMNNANEIPARLDQSLAYFLKHTDKTIAGFAKQISELHN
jgi:hypothetical protein